MTDSELLLPPPPATGEGLPLAGGGSKAADETFSGALPPPQATGEGLPLAGGGSPAADETYSGALPPPPATGAGLPLERERSGLPLRSLTTTGPGVLH